MTFAELADDIETVVRRHIADAWFPECVNPAGGYFEDLDREWQPGESRDVLLEFQARQTRVAALLALAYPEDGRWHEFALHGLRFLRDRMWDKEFGGWFNSLNGDGQPLEASTKHSHGASYATQAAAVVYRATGDRSALEHAEEALAWYDRHARDREFGGFQSWMTREGRVIEGPPDVPEGAGPLDPLGHAVGIKDTNVLGDWFEALLDFVAVSDDALGRELLEEHASIFASKALTEEGALHYSFQRDWMPLPGPEWYGYGMQAMHRLIAAAKVLDRPELAVGGFASGRHAIARARDRHRGGFCFAGPANPNPILEGRDTRVGARSWWVQVEAVDVLARLAVLEPGTGPYTRLLHAHWRFFTRRMLDEKFGGVFSVPDPLARSPRHPRPRDPGGARKARPWKDASHEAAALLRAIAVLRSG